MTKSWKKIVKATAIAIGCVSVLATTALAGTAKSDYDVIVKKFNGSSYTSSQYKATTGEKGFIYFEFIGGGYVVDCRMEDFTSNSKGAWIQNARQGDSDYLPSTLSQRKGDQMSTYISNELFTPVDVRVYGQWASN